MNTSTDKFARLYEYDTWSSRIASGEGFYLAGFRVFGNEIDTARLITSREIQFGENQRLLRTTWSEIEHSGRSRSAKSLELNDSPLLFDNYQQRSQSAAFEVLLEILAEIHLPVKFTRAFSDIGDIAFVAPDESMVLFASGNSVNKLSRVGASGSVVQAARQLNRRMTSRPDNIRPIDSDLEFRLQPDNAEELRVGANTGSSSGLQQETVPLSTGQRNVFAMSGIESLSRINGSGQETMKASDDQACIRIFSSGGNVSTENGWEFKQEDSNATLDIYLTHGENDTGNCKYALSGHEWHRIT